MGMIIDVIKLSSANNIQIQPNSKETWGIVLPLSFVHSNFFNV